jgi:hypothetical protein
LQRVVEYFVQSLNSVFSTDSSRATLPGTSRKTILIQLLNADMATILKSLGRALLMSGQNPRCQLTAKSVQNLLLPKCHRSYGGSALPVPAWQSACHMFLRQGPRSTFMGQLQNTAMSKGPLQTAGGQMVGFSTMHARQWSPREKMGRFGGQGMRRLQARPWGDTRSGQTLLKRGVSYLQFPNRHASLLSKMRWIGCRE